MTKVEMKCTTVEQYFFYSEEVLPPRCKNARYRKQLMAGGGVVLIGLQLIPLLSGLFS